MIHFRIIGIAWLISALVPAVKLALELWSVAVHPEQQPSYEAHGLSFWVTEILVEISFVLIILIGWGLIRVRRWAAVGGKFLGVLSLIVCFWFILSQGMRHGPEPYIAIWCGVALSAYTIFAVWKFRPYDRIAESTAPPNAGAAQAPPAGSA